MPTRPDDTNQKVLRPVEIERERLLLALRTRADRAIRYVCAPVGSGKTTLLSQYAARTTNSRYLSVAAGMTAADLERMVDAASDATELIFDDLDHARPEAIENLMHEVAFGRFSGRRLIVAGKSRRLLHAQNMISRGFGTVLDGQDLAFDEDETKRLADRLGLPFEAKDVAELLHVTEGWALPLAWILRNAADDTRPVRGSFERWSLSQGHLLLELLAEECTRDKAIRRAFMAALADGSPHAPETLAELEIAGCPISRSRGTLRPYRILSRLGTQSRKKSRVTALPSSVEPLTLGLFGRFECRIGARPVVFARRRDQNVLVYVALAPEARVTRQELIAAFWPGVPQAMAFQALRTTLSRLRRAIAEAAQGDVEGYLRVENAISLNLENATVDARRFVEHVAHGEFAEKRGEFESARRHYLAAERLYADHLLSSEAVEPILAPSVADYIARFRELLEKLVHLSSQAREFESARAFERRGIALRPRPRASGETA